MTPAYRAHDDRLLDLLGEVAAVPYKNPVWRVVRDGRSPTDGSRGAGRWNPADLSVLYCSEAADGALSEIHFHLSRGQPVFPSRIRHNLWALDVSLGRTLRLVDFDQLERLGVEKGRYRELLYGRTQEVGAAAAFLGFDGLVSPSARYDCANLVVFLDNAAPAAVAGIDSAPVDWRAWIAGRP
ncbi:MAG: RES family NAD+ phosphorylase [Parvularculaceae bacterium]|nr:RES family NAD+ phosphorylase [Parvularculaceae bacterium]